ncbi:MAG: methyltransferase domain-containing protein [Pseudohongiellaceae bacterium]|nr:methyltransferase domain-containing protein [Pseudohongiellaceae bacterium]
MRFSVLAVATVFLSLLMSSAALAQTSSDERYVVAPQQSQGGIGKFYLGREISGVMGHQAADWLERPQRTHEEMPDEVVANLNLDEDDVVADIGAGSGYFSFRLAEQVPQGKVFAVDIQPEMLQMIEARKAEEKVSNIEGILGEIDDTHLPENSVDLVLLVDAYHEFSHPYEMLESMVSALKPGGRIVLLEYRAEDPNIPIRPLHKMSEFQVVKEMSVFNLNWDDTLDFLPWQHMMIFSKPE